MLRSIFLILFMVLFILQKNYSQDTAHLQSKSLFDSANNVQLKSHTSVITAKKDSGILKPKHDPRTATFRSAVLPGWGQAYNHEYWKIPIVYAALAIPAGFFIYNNTWYNKTRTAFNIVISGDTAQNSQIDPKLRGLDAISLQFYRNQFRKNRDYSALYFFLAWGLNMVDATVFAHLKDFDVSNDLTIHILPTFDPVTKVAGFGLALNYKQKQPRQLLSNF